MKGITVQGSEHTGPQRYTVTRFFSSVKPRVSKEIQSMLGDGEQLAAAALPNDSLPAMTILAAYAKRIDLEIVDDFDELLARMRNAFGKPDVHHPDLFFASAICLLAERGQEPSIGGFVELGVDAILTEVMGEV